MDAKGFELLMSARILDKGGGGSAMDAKGFERLMASKILGKGSGGKIEELEGVPPLTFTANGQPLLDYLISGNTVQNGTPTPENPIMPSGCGERTENLWKYTSSMRDITWWSRSQSTTYFIYYQLSSEQVNVLKSAGNISLRMFLKDGGVHKAGLTVAITNSISIPGTNIRLVQPDGTINSQTFNAERWSNAYLVLGNTNTVIGDLADENIQSLFDNYDIAIVAGSTAPTSYIPYGYKLPITLGSTTTNIYLGEVQSTRRIKKLVFDGEENIEIITLSTSKKGFLFRPNNMMNNGRLNGFCSHFVPQDTPNSSTKDGVTFGAGNSYLYFTFSSDTVSAYNLENIKDIRTWLSTQYAAGTPVTVWYVLAEPETAVVNEPLMKISNYADTVSMEQTGVSIPTNKGNTTLDVGTTLKPSNVYIKYKS